MSRRELLVCAVLVGLLSTLVYQGVKALEAVFSGAGQALWDWAFVNLAFVVLPGGAALALWLSLVGLITLEQVQRRRPASAAAVLGISWFGASLIWFGVYSAVQGSFVGMVAAVVLAAVAGVCVWSGFRSRAAINPDNAPGR
jgi:NO-binding membrane sensor protein with MHYT domain